MRLGKSGADRPRSHHATEKGDEVSPLHVSPLRTTLSATPNYSRL